MEVTPAKRHSETAGRAQAADLESIRGFRFHVRLPPGARPAGPLGRRGRARAGPHADAGPGAGVLPAAAVAAVHHPAGPGWADPGPGEPRLHCGCARPENGRRYYLHSHMAGLGLPRDRHRLPTRKIVGWAMDDNYRTPLISSAIEMAARNLGGLCKTLRSRAACGLCPQVRELLDHLHGEFCITLSVSLLMRSFTPTGGNQSSLKERGRVNGGYAGVWRLEWACVTGVSCFPVGANVRGGRPGQVRDGEGPGRQGAAPEASLR